MRNPWPFFFVLVITGAALIFFEEFLSYGLVWVVGVAAIVLFFIFLIFYVKYNAWLARKINPYILAYKEDHDIEKLKKGFAQWKPWAVTGYSKNSMTVNLLSALLEQPQLDEFTVEVQELKKRAVTTQEWEYYHLFMAEYAKRTGDSAAEEKERKLSQELKEKAEKKKETSKEPATAGQSRRAFWLWLLFDLFLFAGGFLWAVVFRSTPLFSVGIGAFIFSWFVFPVVIVWLLLWLKRRSAEG